MSNISSSAISSSSNVRSVGQVVINVRATDTKGIMREIHREAKSLFGAGI